MPCFIKLEIFDKKLNIKSIIVTQLLIICGKERKNVHLYDKKIHFCQKLDNNNNNKNIHQIQILETFCWLIYVFCLLI